MTRITDPTEAAQAFQRGEEAGFTYFFNKHYAPLVGYAYRFVRDKDVAEDKVCESFKKLLELHEQFLSGHPKPISSWLYTTVRNACLNYLLTEKRKQKIEQDIYENVWQKPEPSPDADVIKREIIKELYTHIDKLAPDCKRIFYLLCEGYSVRQVSEILNVHISTVKNQQLRGKEYLFAFLNGWKRKRQNTAVYTPGTFSYDREQRKKEIISLYKSGMSCKHIAGNLNVSQNLVQDVVAPIRREMSDKEMRLIAELIKQGKRAVDICSIVKCTVSVFRTHRNNARKLGLC